MNPLLHRSLLLGLAGAASCALAACGGTGGGPGGAEPPHFLYRQDAQSLENPFPDLRLLGPGGFVPRPRWYEPFLAPEALTPKMRRTLDGYAAGFAELTGVGNFGPTLLRASEPLDRSSLAGIAARLERTQGGWRVLEADVVVEHVLDSVDAAGAEPTPGIPEFLLVRPSVPLREGAVGLLVLRRGARTAGGVELGRGVEFDGEPWSASLRAEAAAALAIPPEDVLLALPLRASQVSADFQRLADWARANPPASLVPTKELVLEGSAEVPLGIWRRGEPGWSTLLPVLERPHFARPADSVGTFVQGTMLGRDLREEGVIRPDWLLEPNLAPTLPVRFVLTLPAAPPPPGGYRVVLGAHGFNGRNSVLLTRSPESFCGEMAELLSREGLACLGIDAPSHGSRGSSLEFFDIPDLRKTRDRFRQMTFDLLQLARLAPRLDVDGDGQAELSDEVSLFGSSLGAMMGVSLLAYAPDIDVSVLTVGGGGLSNILLSQEIRDRIGLLLVKETDVGFATPEYYASIPLFRAAAQLLLETGDPVVHAQLAPREGHAVLVQEGLGDRTVPNLTTEDLARALDAQPHELPARGPGALRALVRTDPARLLPPERAAGYNGHDVFWDFAVVRRQAMRFLESRGTEVVSE